MHVTRYNLHDAILTLILKILTEKQEVIEIRLHVRYRWENRFSENTFHNSYKIKESEILGRFWYEVIENCTLILVEYCVGKWKDCTAHAYYIFIHKLALGSGWMTSCNTQNVHDRWRSHSAIRCTQFVNVPSMHRCSIGAKSIWLRLNVYCHWQNLNWPWTRLKSITTTSCAYACLMIFNFMWFYSI